MNANPPIACSLTADDYATRLADIERLGRDGLLGLEETPSGATLIFRDSTDLEGRIAQIVTAEAACCPFLAIDLSRQEAALVLRITGAEAAAPVIKDLVANFGRGASA